MSRTAATRCNPTSAYRWQRFSSTVTHSRGHHGHYQGIRIHTEGDQGEGRRDCHLDERWDHCTLGDGDREGIQHEKLATRGDKECGLQHAWDLRLSLRVPRQ